MASAVQPSTIWKVGLLEKAGTADISPTVGTSHATRTPNGAIPNISIRKTKFAPVQIPINPPRARFSNALVPARPVAGSTGSVTLALAIQ